jgi:hypothetical protein
MTETVVNSKEGNTNKEVTKYEKTIVCIRKQRCGFGRYVRCLAEELDIRESSAYRIVLIYVQCIPTKLKRGSTLVRVVKQELTFVVHLCLCQRKIQQFCKA